MIQPEPPASGRPVYTPEPGDTADDLIAHLKADVAWLESVIEAARGDLSDNDVSGAEAVLRYSGVKQP